MAGLDQIGPGQQGDLDQAVAGRPVGMPDAQDGWPSYGETAARLFDNGYEPLPIIPCEKRPAIRDWAQVPIDEQAVETWSSRFAGYGVGLRTGRLVGLDIDLLDPELSHQIYSLAMARLGQTFQRTGLWPKRLLLYRTDEPAPKITCGKIEVLGVGQQFVAFVRHPDTGRIYDWPDGETPLDVPLEDLPLISGAAVEAFLAEADAILPEPGSRGRSRAGAVPGSGSHTGAAAGPVRDDAGRVIDGRDGWLSSIAFHAVHDARDMAAPLDVREIAARVWDRFIATTDLSRPCKDGAGAYGPCDAETKVRDKLRLLAEGRLPERAEQSAETDYVGPEGTVAEARERLDDALSEAMETILAWHAGESFGPAPQIGISATVGLGKSVAARRHVEALRHRLRSIGAPDRILVLTPSHKLAEETAAAWAKTGVRAAVLRGYERKDPITNAPMCLDIGAVRTAVAASLDVHASACESGDRRCRLFDLCLKQENRRAVARAEVIVAPYDALWTGFAGDASGIGLILIDEAFWPRAIEETAPIDVAGFMTAPPRGLLGKGRPDRAAAEAADLVELRRRAGGALLGNGEGSATRAVLVAAGLDAESCRHAAALEAKGRPLPNIAPGMTDAEREAAIRVAADSRLARARETLWRALGDMRDGRSLSSARVTVRSAPAGGTEVVVRGLKRIHHTLAGKPVLHLDATLRPELARALLPDLETTEIDAPAPHMKVSLFTGGFGKSALIRDGRASPEETSRRAAKLRACVDHVAWESRRGAPGRTLVITYKDCEAAFAAIPGVETAHFNAVAGLDRWRDVALLIVVGRPLPSDDALPPLAGARFGQVAEGGYRRALAGVRMRDGSVRGVGVVAHDDPAAETLRAAITDDELIQAIGRGRGVNRTEADPLEVQILADVALPLVHDRIVPWDLAAPDLMQRMLLAGVAVDSPGDAAALHPALFANAEQAKKAFQRGVFGGHSPMSISYRGLSPKSARYRRGGRGRSWQTAWWLEGTPDAALHALTAALGALAAWEPDAQ